MTYTDYFCLPLICYFIVQYSGFDWQSSNILFRPEAKNYSAQYGEGMNELIESIFDIMVVFAFFLYPPFLFLFGNFNKQLAKRFQSYRRTWHAIFAFT